MFRTLGLIFAFAFVAMAQQAPLKIDTTGMTLGPDGKTWQLPNATVGKPYSFNLKASGGNVPYTIRQVCAARVGGGNPSATCTGAMFGDGIAFVVRTQAGAVTSVTGVTDNQSGAYALAGKSCVATLCTEGWYRTTFLAATQTTTVTVTLNNAGGGNELWVFDITGWAGKNGVPTPISGFTTPTLTANVGDFLIAWAASSGCAPATTVTAPFTMVASPVGTCNIVAATYTVPAPVGPLIRVDPVAIDFGTLQCPQKTGAPAGTIDCTGASGPVTQIRQPVLTPAQAIGAINTTFTGPPSPLIAGVLSFPAPVSSLVPSAPTGLGATTN